MFIDFIFKIVVPALGAIAAIIAILKFISAFARKSRVRTSTDAPSAPTKPQNRLPEASLFEIVATVVMEDGSPAVNAVITDKTGRVIAAVNDEGTAVWEQANDGNVHEYHVRFDKKLMYIQNHTNQDIATSFFVDKNRCSVDLTVFHRKPPRKSHLDAIKRNADLM